MKTKVLLLLGMLSLLSSCFPLVDGPGSGKTYVTREPVKIYRDSKFGYSTFAFLENGGVLIPKGTKVKCIGGKKRLRRNGDGFSYYLQLQTYPSRELPTSIIYYDSGRTMEYYAPAKGKAFKSTGWPTKSDRRYIETEPRANQ